MAMRPRTYGGGWPAIWYALRKARASGGLRAMLRGLRSKNACKTCALGMGGQLGGMVNELGRFPEVCKKSIQAMAADMQGRIHPHFFSDISLDQLRGFSSRELEAAGRLAAPVYTGPLDSHYRPLSWDEAIARIAAKLKKTPPPESFFYLSGRSSNEAGFLLHLLARLYGTNNVNSCSYYCHQASGVGLASVTGSGTATVTLEDLHDCDLIFILGANPASNHPRFMRALVDLKRRGGKVIVINPIREVGLMNFRVPSDARSMLFGSRIADEYVQPRIGGDIALLTGLAKAVLERGTFNRAFVTGCCDGWDAFRSHVEAHPWELIERESGVDRGEIHRVAEVYSRSKSAIFSWAMGITHHRHGVENVQAIANLALMRGMLGRPGAGLLPLRGHSNVQGIGSIGAVPRLRESVLSAVEREFNVTLPKEPGMDTIECLRAAASGGVRFAFCLGGNLYGSNPDAVAAARAFAKIDMAVYLSTTLNTGHAGGGRGRETIILPVLARDEEEQPTTQESMFNYVRLSDGGPRRLEGPRSETDIIATLAEAVFDGASTVNWAELRSHERIRQIIARVIPGYSKIGEIDGTKAEFHIEGRTLHQPRFNTDTGRAKFHMVVIPRGVERDDDDASAKANRRLGAPVTLSTQHSASSTAPGTGAGAGGRDTLSTQHSAPSTASAGLRLMTIRSEGQFNTVVYEEEDIYRGTERRDVILMNRRDVMRLGLVENQRVTVRSAAGALSNVLVRLIDIAPGCAAMYYPEANVLIPAEVDPRSGTPAFKHAPIVIEPEAGTGSHQPSAVSHQPGAPATRASRQPLKAC
jgi:molybdopterin-dependent oxidoreductase alpha subunit